MAREPTAARPEAGSRGRHQRLLRSLSFSFFHYPISGTTYFSGASTDVVAHEIGQGLLDAIRPDLWDAPYLEAGAFHEAFGDCVAILTALEDRDTRKKLLAVTTTLKKKNFVESTAENLSEGIRRLVPDHNAAEPRHAWNTFEFQIPETLPLDGGPGELINEVHSFGMLFSGCFYDLIAAIFGSHSQKTEAKLLASARAAGSLLVEGASTAIITPRFFQSVGRAMVLADEAQNDGEHRDRIRAAFERHNIMLGANALLAPTTVLSGAAPRRGGVRALGPRARRDLMQRLGAAGERVSVEPVELAGRRFTSVTHVKRVPLGAVHDRLRGVSIAARVPVIIGESGGRPAVMGQLPEPVSIEREVHAFVSSLLANGQIDVAGSATPSGPSAAAGVSEGKRGSAAARRAAVPVPTHRVTSVGGKKVLVRVRFQCR